MSTLDARLAWLDVTGNAGQTLSLAVTFTGGTPGSVAAAVGPYDPANVDDTSSATLYIGVESDGVWAIAVPVSDTLAPLRLMVNAKAATLGMLRPSGFGTADSRQSLTVTFGQATITVDASQVPGPPGPSTAIVPGAAIAVDATDPAAPVVSVVVGDEPGTVAAGDAPAAAAALRFPAIPVTLFAAMVDGDDWLPAFEAARAAAVATGIRTVYWPGRGIDAPYVVSSACELPSNFELFGDVTTSLRLGDGANCDVVTNDDWVNGNADISVRQLHLDGNRTGQTSVVGDGPGQSCLTFVNVARPHIDDIVGTSPVLHVVDLAVRDYHANSHDDPGCTDFLVGTVIGDDFGDDCVTTHWAHRGHIDRVIAYDNAGSYSDNSGAVEIDDGSTDITVGTVTGTNCDFALNVKGHPNRGTARRVVADRIIAENCIRGLVLYGDLPYATTGPLPGPGRQVAISNYIAKDCISAIQVVGYATAEIHGMVVDDCDNLFSNGDPLDDTICDLLFVGGQVYATRTVLDNPWMGKLKFVGTSFRGYGGASGLVCSALDLDVEFAHCYSGDHPAAFTGALHVDGARRVRIIGGDYLNAVGAAVRLTSGGSVTIDDAVLEGNASAGDLYIAPTSTIDRLLVSNTDFAGPKGLNVASSAVRGMVHHCRAEIAPTNASPDLTVSDMLFPPPSFLTQVPAIHAVWADDPDWSRPADGSPVDSWRNVSGGGDPATTGATRPTMRTSLAAYNDRAAVEFGGSHYLDYDVASSSQPLKVVIVGNLTPAAAAQLLFGRGAGSNGVGCNAADEWMAHMATALSGGTADSDPHVFRATLAGASSTLRVDEAVVATGNAGSGGLGRLTLGASSNASPTFTEFLTGHLAFVGIYAGATADADLEQLAADLAGFYDIALA